MNFDEVRDWEWEGFREKLNNKINEGWIPIWETYGKINNAEGQQGYTFIIVKKG